MKRGGKFAEIKLTDDGFVIVAGSRFAVRWRDILRVVAFERDQFTTDLLCLAFEAHGWPAGTQYEVNEEIHGFEALVNVMSQQLSLRPNWRRDVLQPAFAANPTVIFESKARSSSDK